MAVLFNSALKQSKLLQNDIDSFAASPQAASAALQGQISATLMSFSRCIDDYEGSAGNELNQAKAEKAKERVNNFRHELQDYRQRYAALKRDKEENLVAQNRTELLGRRPHHAATPENPYTQSTSSAPSSNPLFAGRTQGSLSFGANPSTLNMNREQHALREQSFFSQQNAALDEYLERGRAVLGDLGTQNEMLKGAQKRMYDVASTLGISGDTIRMVERRAKQDKWIFWGGVVVFFGFCWFVLRYLRG